MTIDIDADAIEARAKKIAKREQDEFPEIDVENSTLHISVQYHELIALCAEVRELRAALGRLLSAAKGRGMVSEMDGLPEIAVLVVGLHERAEVARLTAALAEADGALSGCNDEILELRAALRQPAPAQAWCNCGMGDGTMPELHSQWCAVQEPAPADCHVCKGSGRNVSQENISYQCRWCDGSGKEPAPAGATDQAKE